MFTVDAALQHTCAGFRERAAQGEITGLECDLLIDGAILLAINLESLIQDARAGAPPMWPDIPAPGRRLRLRGSDEGVALM